MDPSYNNLGGNNNPGGATPGVGDVPTGSGVPVSGAPVSGASASGASASNGAPASGAPLGGAPLGGAPLGGAPLGGAPLGGAPLGGGPLGSNMLMGGASMKNRNAPISSGTGDIVLDDSGDGRGSHKGVVVLIVLVVLLALVGGGFLLWQSGASGGGGVSKPSAELVPELKKIVNYMYLGEQSEADLAEIPDDAEFRFETIFYSGSLADRTGYFETALNLQAEAMDTLLNNENDVAGSYNTLLTDINMRLNRVSAVAMTNGLSVAELRDGYVDIDSVPVLKKTVGERYESLLNSDNEDLEFYGQAYVDFLNMWIDEFALIEQNDCLNYATDLEDFNGLEECPTYEELAEAIEALEDKKGKLGSTPSEEKDMADGMIEGDINNLIWDYKQLSTELSK